MSVRGNGRLRISGVEIGEIRIDLFGQPPNISASYALLDVDENTRHGRGDRNIWNEDTLKKVLELKEQMEKEICADLFEGGPINADQPDVTQPLNDVDAVPSL